MTQAAISQAISSGKTFLGIELGSTRIKAVLIGEDHAPLASGGYGWENADENLFDAPPIYSMACP